jgi:hypothetical protein
MTRLKMTPEAMATFWQRAYELTVSPDADASELKCAGLLARECVEPKLSTPRPGAEREKYQADTAEMIMERREELPPPYPENPLDDREKLEEVRLMIFGRPPEAKPITPNPPPNQ